MSSDYDDDRELAKYLSEHLPSYMTEFELRAWRAFHMRAKISARFGDRSIHPRLREFAGLDDPAIDAALVDGLDAFCRRVQDRVLAEEWAAAAINRCPSCRRIVRTPQARQCFWCGFDWHP